MNKEEILARSRTDSKNGDERDLKNREKSYSISASVATFVCIVMVAIEEGLFKRNAMDIWVIYAAIEFATALSGAILSKKKWLIVLSVFMGLLFVAMVFFYIQNNLALL